MQNRYTGDIGDYGKLGLLRWLEQAGMRIGVNWYLTPDGKEKNDDGKFVKYLKNQSFRNCDPQLWEALGEIVNSGTRKICSLQTEKILKAVFYDAEMNFCGTTSAARKEERCCWHQDALARLSHRDIVFVDPDNGLMVPSAIGRRKNIKYVLSQELHDYYAAGASVIYYQHKARCKDFVYTARNRELLESGDFPDARTLGLKFRTTSQRFYFFILQPQHELFVQTQIQAMLKTEWKNHFSLCE